MNRGEARGRKPLFRDLLNGLTVLQRGGKMKHTLCPRGRGSSCAIGSRFLAANRSCGYPWQAKNWLSLESLRQGRQENFLTPYFA